MAKKKHDRWAEAQSSGLDALEKSGYRFSAPPQVEEAQAPIEPESRGVAGWAKDGGISLLKGAIALPESFVGMADIATGGRVGKALEGVGYEPSRARAILDEYLTDNQKAANAEFQKAEGIPGKFAAAIQNPSVIGQAVIESAPSMLGGAGVARGLLGVAPKMGAVAAGALGEGIIGAGQAAEQIRTQTPDRLLSTDQSMSALASGAGTAVFGALGGKISQRLGIGDVDTMLAQAAINPVARKGVVRAAIEGFISEGVLEELPQSIQEQVWQNQALGRPLSDGVDEAAVLGLLSGGAMGMVAGPMSSGKAGDPIRDLKTGGTDPLSRAADIGLDAKAKQADVGITEGQYNAAMAAMEGQLSDDQKAIKSQGRADKTGFAGQPTPKAPSMAQAMGLMGDATQEVSAFTDRAMLVKESLADPTTRDFIRQNLGDEAFNEAAYYAEQADRPGDIPDKTRENMLALAEAIISRARLTPITPPAGLGSNVGPAPDALGAPQAVPAIGLDTTPTGAFRVDAAGNAAPEVRADVISTRQAQAERDVLGTQARKSSAVPADPAPAQPQAPKALGYDTAPTGVVRVDSQGQARPETRADQINARQSAPARDDTTGQQARKASAVWADPAPKKRETPALGYDTAPTGRMVSGPDGISVETNAERINRQQARSTQPGDITRPGGQPFKNLTAAKTEQRRSGGAVVEVTGGWVVRPQAETINGDTGQTAGRSAGSVGAGSPDAPAGTQGAGFGSDVRGRTDAGGSGRADGAGVSERNIGSPVAAQPGAARDARGQLSSPAFLRKTLPEMTEDELTQASEFYGADHPRASKVKQEVEKRERKAKFEAKKNPKPEPVNEQDAPQTQSAPTQAKPGQEGSDPAGTGTPGDGAKERVPGAGGADVQANGVTGQVVDKRPKARKHPPTVRGSGALADISRALGGLSPDLLSDLSEKVRRTRVSKAGKKTQYTTWDNPAIPGIGPLFRMGGTADLSEVARVLEESGYLEAGAVENDPVGAKQRAEAIIKAELREGGRTLRVGDADAIESEMRGRQEAAMDEMSDPWDDFSFAPEDLDAAGYTGLSEETRAATEQLIAEAEGLGIDTEAIRDDTARIVGDSASQEEYHAATQEAIRQAIAQVGRNAQQADASGAREGDQGGGSPAEQAGGTRSQGQRDGGSDQEGLSLTAPTRADIEAQQDRAEQADTLDEKAQAKRASEVGDSTFMTGFTGDGRQDNTADLFSQGAQEQDQQAATGGIAGATAGGSRSVPAVKQAKPSIRIDDIGEKIGGARKDVWTSFKDDLKAVADGDIRNEPLSKVWPAPDYQKLIDGGLGADAVALVRSFRDEIPAKPRAAWKVKRWAEQVKTLREFANDLLSGSSTAEQFRKSAQNLPAVSRGILGRADLYMEVGHAKSLEGISLAHHHYTLYRGRENVSMWVVERDAAATAFSNWPQEIATGDTKAEAIEAFKKKYATLDAEKQVKKASFDIISTGGKFYVAKKIGRNFAKLAGPFATVKEAREHRAGNIDALEKALEAYKEIPRERRDVNDPRVGEDMRNGTDVTPEFFAQTFGFRGVEFGNWVEQGRRQKDLNDAFDALMDMAAVLGLPPKAISLNGELGLAFGARGGGGVGAAAAHYEDSKVVINLTKKEGAGSLGHEWWHAVDNYFSRMRKQPGDMMTTALDVSLSSRGSDFNPRDGVRREMVQAFGQVVGAIKKTAMKARSERLDAKRSKDYWTTGDEMSARAFESYLIAKLQDQEASNDYLANVVDQRTWDAMAALGIENENSYPYPTADEIPAIREGFDRFFQTVQTREDDAGNVGMFSRSPEDESFYRSQVDYEWAPPSVVNRVKQQVESLRTFWKNSPEVVVLASFADAPVEMQKLNDKQVQNGAVGEPEGFFYKGKAYLLAPHMKGPEDVRRVLFHETLGHLGLRGVFGDGLNQILDQLWATRRKDVQAKADAYGLDTSKQGNRRMAAEEVLAEMAQDRPEIGFVRRAVAIVKQWLRKNLPGFAKMKMSDDEIIANFLMPAQRFIERGQGAQGQQLVPAFSRVDEAGSGFGRNMPATIKVDGKDRPTMSSNGQPIHPTEEVVRNFWKWFGDSKVVDEKGEPLVVYHGTAADGFSAFGEAGGGIYFAEDPAVSEFYAEDATGLRNGAQPFYLKVENLFDATGAGATKVLDKIESEHDNGTDYRDPDDGEYIPLSRWVQSGYLFKLGRDVQNEVMESLRAEGFDGVRYVDASPATGDAISVVVFEPTQIKSATGNSGDFNPEDPNIGFSRSAAATDLNTKARNAFSDFVGSAGVQMDWLDKTLKTQYAKAERFPEFKRVFDKLQDYIEGVSSFANQAADKAPDILPKLDSFKDLMREGPESLLRHGLSQEDIKALSAPVFEGTLSWTRDANGELVETQDPAGAGVVFTDAELRDKFGMSKKQIGHYRQFRATVDESLDQVVAADIIKLLGKKAPAGLKALANTADGRARLREALRQTFGNSDDADAKAMWDDQIAPKYDHVASMKAKGYAPLSRFGKFFVHVVDKQTGETAYFGMEETRIMSNRTARDLREEFGTGFDVTQGMMSQESYKLMSDVPVDAMEMFASAIGAEKSEVFQKYIALAKNNRSTLKRLLKRKGRAGYSLDAPRVLASFVTSNARASAAAVNMMDAKELAQGIQAGDVKDEAIKLIEAVGEPQESGAAVRGLMFTNFIGGSIASAVVNMTQPVMMTLPYLSQFGGITKAGKRLVSAAGMAVSGKVSDPEISEALKRAESEGIVAPQEIHHLLKQATSSAHINPKVDAAIQKLAFVWSTPFALAESFNRKASFIAAYQTAKDEGIANPYAFAQKAVTETQGLYNAGNKPNAARGTLGATVMTFKQYSIHYLEWLARMAKSGPEGKKAALWALALLVMAAGSDGLPFSEDLNDVIDTVGQSFGYDTNTKRWRHQVAADALGEEAAEVLSRGLSASAGFPVDVSMRMGMGNLLPATDMLKKSNTDTARSLAELAGPGGALFTQYSDAIKLMLSGEAGAAAMKMTPNAIQNLGKAAKMMETGEYRDSKDRKVMEVDGVDAAMKALSFQPAQIARESAKMSENRQSEMLAKAVEGEITDAWARAMVDGDAQAQEGARQRLLDWNKKNPDMPIRVSRAQIATKAKKMRQSRAERYIKTVAPERRQAATKEVES